MMVNFRYTDSGFDGEQYEWFMEMGEINMPKSIPLSVEAKYNIARFHYMVDRMSEDDLRKWLKTCYANYVKREKIVDILLRDRGY